MKKESNNLTKEQISELTYLAELRDDFIDVADIPEVMDWTGAQRGVFYKPVKQQITLRLDADIIHWFRARMPDGKGYQTQINLALRYYISQQAAKAD